MIDEAYANAAKIIAENRSQLEKLAAALLEKETMDGKDVENLIKGEQPDEGPQSE
jgi:cell division protease FtsH